MILMAVLRRMRRLRFHSLEERRKSETVLHFYKWWKLFHIDAAGSLFFLRSMNQRNGCIVNMSEINSLSQRLTVAFFVCVE